MPIPEQKLNFLKKYMCQTCGITIYSNRTDLKFCSNKCRQRNYRDNHNLIRNEQIEEITNITENQNNNSINQINPETMHTEILAANMKINSLETDLKLFKKDYEALQKENQTFLLSIDVLKKEKEEIQIKFELSQKELFQTAENLKKIETEKESLKVETDLKISTLEKEKIELEIKIQNIEKEKIQTGFCLTEANQKLQECENKIKGYEKSSNSVNTDIVKEESLIETNKEKETESYMKLMGF